MGNEDDNDLRRIMRRNLEKFSDDVQSNRVIGHRPHGPAYKATHTFTIKGTSYAVVSKFQNTTGSVDFKLPYEVISLAHSVETNNEIQKGFLVLGGQGYSKGMLNFVLNNLHDWLNITTDVEILMFDDFIGRLRSSAL
jgi:hypothetical protein